MRDRRLILMDLVNFRQDVSHTLQELSEYTWDCEEPLLIISHTNVEVVLDMYLTGKIDKCALEEWANAIESSEDLSFTDDSLEDAINKIANPVLYGDNSSEKIEALRKIISKNSTFHK